MPIPQHEDFGQKIGGAKKDLWSDRGLYTSDLSEMNEREAEKYVRKDNVWKKPDYSGMIARGTPTDVVYFIKKVRDSLSAAPYYYRTDDTPEKRLARQEQYIDTVRALQSVMEKVRSREDAMQAYERFMLDSGYVEKQTGWISGPQFVYTHKAHENPLITNKLAQTLRVRTAREFEYNFTRKAAAEQFGVSKELKIPKGFAVRFNDSKGVYSRDGDWKPNTYYVTKRSQILCTNLETYEEALKWAQDYATQRGATGKKRFTPPQLSDVRRTGPDFRGGRDIVGQDYIDAFGFRGGEYGNWMNQNDRQASLNMGYDALKDLCSALKISEKDISYGGVLSIAFGARGSGSAVAHYEPLRKVINLTKMRGAGSLAHEWWHGLDDYLGVKMGAKGFLSDSPRVYPPFQKLIDTIKYKSETPKQAAARAVKQAEISRKGAASWLDSAMGYSVRRADDPAVTAQYEHLKESFLAGEPGSVQQLNDLKKSISGHVIPKADRERLQTYERILQADNEPQEPVIGRIRTDYYMNSVRMGKECEKDGGYWDSNVELTARAFACYVQDRLPYRSDYLDGHAECAVSLVSRPDGEPEVIHAYPQGAEREAINAVFDEIVADLKLEHIFTHSEQPLSLAESERPSVLGQLVAGKQQQKPAPAAAKAKPEPEI